MAAPSTWDRFLAAIRAQESGGNYSENVAGCLGAYCWNAQSNWDGMAKAAGESKYVGVNPSQVPANIQDKVASTNLSRIYQQAGGGTRGYQAAAMWWNGGTTVSEPNPGLPAQPWAKHCGGGSSAAYACQVLTRMGLGGHFLAGSGAQSGAGGVVTTAAGADADCAIHIPIPGLSFNFNPVGGSFGPHGTTSSQCILSKSEARALLAVANLVAGGVLLGVGFGFVAAFSRPGRAVMTFITTTVPGGQALAGGARAAPGSGGVGTPLTQQQIRQANANRRKLAKAAGRKAGGP